MEFCPKCGSIIVEKRKNYGCLRCGYVTKDKIKLKTSEKTDEKDRKKVAVVKKTGEEEILPTTDANCKQCGHNKSFFWTVQTRSGDEAETKFFRCMKCGYTWREYR